MPIKMERRLFKVGEGSFAVTLPKAWISYKQLKHGDVVEVLVDEDVVIRTKILSEEGVKKES
jgi:antitoxin component of MazEF toxin-antitoxin module